MSKTWHYRLPRLPHVLEEAFRYFSNHHMLLADGQAPGDGAPAQPPVWRPSYYPFGSAQEEEEAKEVAQDETSFNKFGGMIIKAAG